MFPRGKAASFTLGSSKTRLEKAHRVLPRPQGQPGCAPPMALSVQCSSGDPKLPAALPAPASLPASSGLIVVSLCSASPSPPQEVFSHLFGPVHAAQPRSKRRRRAASAAHSSGDVLENKKNWSLLVLHTPSGGTGMESAGVTHQHSCFGRTLLDNLPMPQSNHPGKQEHEPAQTQSRGWRRHLPEPRGNCRFPPCSGCRRVKNSLQISVSKCGGREQSAVYQCQGFP